MVLVDTSAWIAMFRPGGIDLEAHVGFDDIVICPPVVQEVLQGFRNERSYRSARQALFNMPAVESPMELGLFEEAAQLYRGARASGVTVRSSVDCLIAAAALRHDLEVLHVDRDFSLLARTCPLKQRRIRA